jgi:N-acetylglucosaminyldiphosphoundecaprenol N-acetyl-beta-D-mannosaminyltransferase
MNDTITSHRQKLFGIDIDALTMEQSVDWAFDRVESGVPAQHVVVNAAKVVLMHSDVRLRSIIDGCALVNADGTSIVWASRLLGKPLPERVTGIDLFMEIIQRAAGSGHRCYFLGARDDVLEEMLSRFRERFPDLVVAGHRDGYWEDDGEVIAAVRATSPDFLFLAIPSPHKEFWLAEHLDELGVPFVVGVGGSFDVLAGKVRRAPVWLQRLGCEWLYRLLQEPGRMWKRYLVGNTKFVMLVAREWRSERAQKRK